MSLFKQLRILGAVLGLLLLGSCGKTYDPNDPVNRTCLEQLKVFDYKGQKAWKTMGGQYIKVGSIGISECSSLDGDPKKAKEYVAGGGSGGVWYKGKLYDHQKEFRHLLPKDKDGFPDMSQIGVVRVDLKLSSNLRHSTSTVPDWWYSPALPHQLYPIDLLPNWGLNTPDPDEGRGLLKSDSTPYWAVRGTRHHDDGFPFVNRYCSMKPPTDVPADNHTWYRDIQKVLKQPAEPWTKGNTCRGGIVASNGSIGGVIDTPGILLPEIDKVFNAVSIRLSDIVIE